MMKSKEKERNENQKKKRKERKQIWMNKCVNGLKCFLGFYD